MRYGIVLLVVLLGVACTESPPPLVAVDVGDGATTGPITVNTADGGSTVGTAPCGAQTTDQSRGPVQPVQTGPDCSSNTAEPVIVTVPAAEARR